MDYTDPYVIADIEDAERIIAWHLNHPFERVKETAPGYPTFHYAIEVAAPMFKIGAPELISLKRHGTEYHALVRCHCAITNRSIIGASKWIDPTIAFDFAWRNSIRQLIPQ